MKRLGKTSLCLVSGLACSLSVMADDDNTTTTNLVSSDNPYAAIVVRNVFGIQPPPPPPPPVDPTIANPPPKIIPNGIMNLFGTMQVLFKVEPINKPGQPPGKEETYTLAEGDGADEISVVKIDEKKEIVTFNNHGYNQDIPLTPAPLQTSAGGPGGPGGPGGGGIPMPRRGFFGGGPRPMGMGGAMQGNPTPDNPNPNMGGGGNQLTPEAQAILLEAQRSEFEDAASGGNSKIPASAASIIPPTPLTKQLEDEKNAAAGGPPSP